MLLHANFKIAGELHQLEHEHQAKLQLCKQLNLILLLLEDMRLVHACSRVPDTTIASCNQANLLATPYSCHTHSVLGSSLGH